MLSRIAIASVLAITGCYGGASYQPATTTRVSVSQGPELYVVGPGVQAVVGRGAPIYYANGVYWRYYEGNWFWSTRTNGQWTYEARPPAALMRIDRPYTYYYRSHGQLRVDRERFYYPQRGACCGT